MPLHNVNPATGAGAQRLAPAVEPRESADMMQLLTTAAHDVPPPGATPARADPTALVLARSGCGPVGVLPFGLGAPLPPGTSGDGGNAAQILNIHSLIDAAVAIRTPPNPMYDSEATLAAVAAYAGTGIWRPPPVVSHAGNSSADTFPAQSSAADLNGTAAHGGGGAGGGAGCGGGRRGAAGSSSASAVGGTRPRRQLLSREDPAGLEERAGEHGNAPGGGRRRRKGGKGGRAEPEQPEATGRRPGGISEKRGVLRPWPDDGNTRGQLRVIRRKEGQFLLSRHPGVANVLSCNLHTVPPLIPTVIDSASADLPPPRSAPQAELAVGSPAAGALALMGASHSACWHFAGGGSAEKQLGGGGAQRGESAYGTPPTAQSLLEQVQQQVQQGTSC